MRRLKKYIKNERSWIITISIIAFSILCCFFISERSKFHWGDFGSILGAITGLIAFIGVLYTSKQNKQQFLNSEERSTFFEMLKIFISYRDSLRVKKIDWKYDKTLHDWNIIQYEEFCTTEKTYQQITFELCCIFYVEIRNNIPNYLSKEEFAKEIIPSNESTIQWYSSYNYLAIAINNIYNGYNWSKSGGVVNQIPINLNTYDYICLIAIRTYLKQNNFKPIIEAISKTADFCFSKYINQLGTYFRNAYYILEMVSGFNYPKKYSDIFRAQLSKDELVLLFFNSFSSLSNNKTRQLYLDADLFNNLELKDIRLKENINNISRMEYISFPSTLQQNPVKNEYVSYEFLSRLYKSIDIKND